MLTAFQADWIDAALLRVRDLPHHTASSHTLDEIDLTEFRQIPLNLEEKNLPRYSPYPTDILKHPDDWSLPVGAALEIDILVDASVIEIFTSAGTVLNARAYGDPAGPFILAATGCFEGAHCEAVILHPISPDRLASVR